MVFRSKFDDVGLTLRPWGWGGSNLSVGLTLSVWISNFDSPLNILETKYELYEIIPVSKSDTVKFMVNKVYNYFFYASSLISSAEWLQYDIVSPFLICMWFYSSWGQGYQRKHRWIQPLILL